VPPSPSGAVGFPEVPERSWTRLMHLPPGQANVSAQGIDPAMAVSLEPGRCKLQMVD